MKEILNSLISIDNACKNDLSVVQDKKDNIEYLVDRELTKRKEEIKTKYKFKIDMKKNEYNIKLSEITKSIESEKIQEIEKIKNKYESEKQTIINYIIQSIL